MRFPYMFQRFVGGSAGQPVLGSDAAPTNASYLKKRIDGTGAGNVATFRLNNISGFPLQRVIVGFNGPAVSGPLPVSVYLWEESSLAWYLVNASSASLALGGFVAIDTFSLMDTPYAAAAGAAMNNNQPGALDIAIVVAAKGGDPSGTYTFIVGADASNPGF